MSSLAILEADPPRIRFGAGNGLLVRFSNHLFTCHRSLMLLLRVNFKISQKSSGNRNEGLGSFVSGRNAWQHASLLQHSLSIMGS